MWEALIERSEGFHIKQNESRTEHRAARSTLCKESSP